MNRRYPDPDAVVYARPQPAGTPCQLTTQSTSRMFPLHNHGAWMDGEGNGNTDLAAGHFHRIKNFKVAPDESDGHTHELTTLPCGWGAPHTTGRNGPVELAAFGDTETRPSPLAPAGPAEGSGKIIAGVLIAVALIVGGYFAMREEDDGE